MTKAFSLKTKIIAVIITILIILFIFVIKPFIDFKILENKLLESGKRYFEINDTKLPTGNRIKKIYLKELYDKDYVDNEVKRTFTAKGCNVENSFVRVFKSSDNYKYEVYLECGVWKSSIDHEGPVIKLKGQDEISVYKDEKYSELGVLSVVDNTDGVINTNKVKIDYSNVDTSKVGVYEVTYEIKDSYNNITIKKRIVRVNETLNHIVNSQTNNKGIYKGQQFNNYVLLDGILFKIVGINKNKTVKLVTDKTISAINYNDAEDLLNNSFYNKLSDSAKSLIYKKSKWCINSTTNPKNYKKCSKYSKKNPVGLLSIIDINNSKGDNISYLEGTLVNNLKNKKTSYLYFNGDFIEKPVEENIVITPAINIIEDAIIVSGNGNSSNPFRLKGNTSYLKPGRNVSDAKVGDYLNYSGYSWRVIGKEDDGTTKIIMNDVIKKASDVYDLPFTNSVSINFNTSKKENIGYSLINQISSYVNTSLFVSKKINYPKYSKDIGYNSDKKEDNYKLKINLPSMYDILSTSYDNEFYWYKDYSNDKYCYMHYLGMVKCDKYNENDSYGIRVIAYLKNNVKIKSGKGLQENQYTLSVK